MKEVIRMTGELRQKTQAASWKPLWAVFGQQNIFKKQNSDSETFVRAWYVVTEINVNEESILQTLNLWSIVS